jgi:hypothetical protein
MFYSIPNLGSTSVSEMEKPWECGLKMPAEYGPDKIARTSWAKSFATKHAFISGVEGMTATVRVSYAQNNVPHKIHAFIADYDAMVSDSRLEETKADPASEFLPAWFVRTGSGNGRLVWLLSKPILVASKQQVTEFLIDVSKKLRLKNWLAAWDDGAFKNVTEYYEVGGEWIPLFPDAVISQEMAGLWLYESSKNTKLSDDYGSEYNIPMDLVAEEIEKRYPNNKWKGPFEEGRRGVRFWDDSAKDETGAFIMKHGVMAFSGEQAFMSWRMLLGEAFVSRFEADKVGTLREKVAWDGKEFWLHTDQGEWLSECKGDFQQRLEVNGFSSSTPRSATCSEIDRLMVELRDNRRVHRALPFIHFPPGILVYEDRRYLNTSTAVCLQPAKDADCCTIEDAVTFFPFTWNLLKALFKDETPDVDMWAQLNFFLAWLQRFYIGGLTMRPTQGQAVVLIGPQGAGKTLLARGVIAPLVGGMADATEYFTEDSQWTARIMEKALMVVDDSKPVATVRGSVMFSAALKKVVANSRMVYNEKFKQQGEIPHFGRPLVLANFDTTSIQIIPDLDMSNKDKVMLFKAPEHDRTRFPDWDTVSRTLSQELPYFARFLQLWKAPEYTVSEDKRFGVKAFHHPILYREAMESGTNEVLYEFLHAMVTEYRMSHKDKTFWEGNLTLLRKDLLISNEQVAREFPTQKMLSAAMKNIMEKSEYNIECRKLHGERLWRIWFDMRSKGIMSNNGIKVPESKLTALDFKAKTEDEEEGDTIE